jgi:ferredoxin
MVEKNYRIVHDRDICIGCSACASVCPKYWIMEDDGKSSIIGHTKTGDGEEEILGTKEQPLTQDFEGNMDAAESCPVNCIHVKEVSEDGTEKDLI